jgi:HSP20 family protein
MANEAWEQYLANIDDAFSVNQIFLNELQKQTGEEPLTTAEDEGELAIDIYKEPTKLTVTALVAGAAAKDISVGFRDGILTIRGHRNRPPLAESAETLYRECYWGAFSRSVILPESVDSDKIEALMKNGLLIIILPLSAAGEKTIKITEEEG